MKIYIKTLAFAFALLAFAGCDDAEEVLAYKQAQSVIGFTDFPSNSATFTDVDQVIIEAAIDGPAGSLDVSGDGQNFGTITMASGVATFSSTLAQLGYPWGTDNDETSVTLAFATDESQRLFDLSIVSPITLGYTTGTGDNAVSFTSAATVTLDSTFNLYFEAATKNATIDKFEVFTKIGKNASYATTPEISTAVNDTEIEEQSVTLTADNATYDIGDTIYSKIVLTSGTLESDVELTTIVSEHELTETGDFTVVTEDLTSITRFSAFNFSALKGISNGFTTNTDSADIRLDFNPAPFGGASALELEASPTSNTTFAYAPDGFTLSSATYESVKAAYSSAVLTNIINPETLDDSQVILVRIGSIPNGANPVNDSRRYAAFQVKEITKAESGSESTVTFTYKAPKQ